MIRKNARGEIVFSFLEGVCRSELLDRTVPFWTRHAVDWEHGGLCSCLSDDGNVLSRDKYMWSQLRAIGTFSALYNKVEQKREWIKDPCHLARSLIYCTGVLKKLSAAVQ